MQSRYEYQAATIAANAPPSGRYESARHNDFLALYEKMSGGAKSAVLTLSAFPRRVSGSCRLHRDPQICGG